MPPSPFPARRPRVIALSVEDLLERVLRGEVRIPDFQRPFKWRAHHVRELLDSVYRGFPIGALVFWQKEGTAAVLHFGSVKIDAPQTAQALWVIDGQQRITALVAVLLHPLLQDTDPPDDFTFYFDPETEEFIQPSRQGAPPAHWLPMNRLTDNTWLMGWMERATELADKLPFVPRALFMRRAVLDYSLSAYVTEADEAETPLAIFSRLNSGGVSLTRAELTQALQGSRRESFPSLKAISGHLEGMGFGRLRTKWLRKAFLAVRGLDITREVPSQLEEDAHLQEFLSATERALRAAIVFLKRDVGIPHIELMPYSLSLVFLTRFFHLHPEPSARSRELLARWVWRGAISGNHGLGSVRLMRQIIAEIDDREEHSVQRMLYHARAAPSPDLLSPGDFNLRRARSRLQANALLALQPRDLRGGRPLDIPALLERDGASAFTQFTTPLSRPMLTPAEEDVGERFLGGLANRLFHPALPGDDLRAFVVASTPAEAPVLASHGISPDALQALREDDVWRFLATRERTLTEHLRRFLDSRARWEASDHGSLQSMIVSDEED